jgi:alpha-D-ribose 1-methylphosphonate 5-triphosphate synthase subunit PhnH
MSHPLYTADEARSRETFLALMWAFSYPGRLQSLPSDDAFALIAGALLDLETNFYTPDLEIHRTLLQTGARSLSAEKAAYHFYPSLTIETLGDVKRARIGTMLYPDEAATLVIGCGLEHGETFRLSGPGVPGQVVVQLAGLPTEFWRMRANRYPLGWDVLLIDDGRVLGLPRSTTVEQG